MILADFHLPRRLRPAVARAADLVCDADLAARGLADHIVDGLQLALRSYPAGVRHGLLAGLLAFEEGARLRHGRPFSRLPDAAARAWFAAWWSSRVMPMAFFARALKSLIALVYYDAPEVRARIAFHPDAWIAKVARRRLERYAADIERAEAIVRAPDPLVPLARRRHHA